MAELVYAPGSGKAVKTLEKYFQLPERSRLTNKEIDLLVRIKGAFSYQKIDDETAVAIIESFEGKFGKAESVIDRLSKFDNFLSVIGNRQDMIDSVKSMGMLSHAEAELQAVETGDWPSAIKRNEPFKNLASIEPDDKKEKSDVD